MYKVTLLPYAEKSFKKLDKSVQLKIAEKIDWLAKSADKGKGDRFILLTAGQKRVLK